MQNLRELPKVRDSWSFLYVEHCRVDQEEKAIAIHDAAGKTPVPCATLTALMLGPGTRITHAAIRTLADAGCMVYWTGEEGVRFYAQGMGKTRSAHNFLRQAELWANATSRLRVAKRLYQMRFPEVTDDLLTIQQLRGREGLRVRDAYQRASKETGVPWHGRSYNRGSWSAADPVNRALSSATSCLYGICQAAIVAAGYSTALGFIHTGKMLSFVYDVADLYKPEIAIPIAFRATAAGTENLERRVRVASREAFHHKRILGRIVQDVSYALEAITEPVDAADEFDNDAARPSGIWDPDKTIVAGGVNYGMDADDEDDEDG